MRRNAGDIGLSSIFAFPDPVNETSARIVAGGVVTMAVATIALDEPRLMFPLTYGFAVRVLTGPRFSPLGLLATRVITPRLNFEHNLVPGPPKRLAQGIGLAVTASALTLHYGFGKRRAAYTLLSTLVFAAGLESIFGICLGCKMFPLLVRAGIVADSACPDCVASS